MEHCVGCAFDGFDCQRSRFDTGQIKQVIQQTMQVIAVAQHTLQMGVLLGQQRSITVEQQFCETQDRTDGSADLVTHMGKEIRLRAACTFRRVARCCQLSLYLPKMICRFLKFKGSGFNNGRSVFDDSFQIRIQILQAAESFGVFQRGTCDRRQVSGDAQFIRSKQIAHLCVTDDQAGGRPGSHHNRAGQDGAKLRA